MSKCKLIVALTALAAAAAAAPASAQFFAGAGLGQSMTGSSNINTAGLSVSGFDSSELSLQVFGGYQFDKMWGIQVQYTDLGSRNGTACFGGVCQGTQDIKAYQWGVAGTGTFDLGSDFFLKAKLGFSSNHIDGLSGTVNGVSYSSGGSSKTDLLGGLGVGYNWNKNVSTRLEYEYFGKFESNNGGNSVMGSNIGLRFQYSFD